VNPVPTLTVISYTHFFFALFISCSALQSLLTRRGITPESAHKFEDTQPAGATFPPRAASTLRPHFLLILHRLQSRALLYLPHQRRREGCRWAGPYTPARAPALITYPPPTQAITARWDSLMHTQPGLDDLSGVAVTPATTAPGPAYQR